MKARLAGLLTVQHTEAVIAIAPTWRRTKSTVWRALLSLKAISVEACCSDSSLPACGILGVIVIGMLSSLCSSCTCISDQKAENPDPLLK